MVALAGLAVLGCAPTSTPSSMGRRVDIEAIARELSREVPGLEDNAAFRAQVNDIADLCRSSAEDFRINARSIATPDLQRDLRRQIDAGCPWRSAEVARLLRTQGQPGNR